MSRRRATTLARKAERLHAICVNLAQNVAALRENLEASRMTAVPRELAERVTRLRSHRTWVDFTTPTETGRQMRQALDQVVTVDPEGRHRLHQGRVLRL